MPDDAMSRGGAGDGLAAPHQACRLAPIDGPKDGPKDRPKAGARAGTRAGTRAGAPCRRSALIAVVSLLSAFACTNRMQA